jgi:hypothetical protein
MIGTAFLSVFPLDKLSSPIREKSTNFKGNPVRTGILPGFQALRFARFFFHPMKGGPHDD